MLADKKSRIWMIILLALALLGSVYAFTGEGGGIEAISDTGTLTSQLFNSSNAPYASAIGNYYPAGSYNGAFGGYFGNINTTSDAASENLSISIAQVIPINNSGSNDTIKLFRIITSGSDILNCSLIIDGVIDTSITYPDVGPINFITTLPIGLHSWEAVCYDLSRNQYNSSRRKITILQTSTFEGETTDFTQVDLSNITNLTIHKPSYGKIIFNGTTNLSGGIDIDSNIIISYRSIFLNSQALGILNKSATLTMVNPELSHPTILKDGVYCTDCNILNYNTNLTFDVLHFSNYSATENSELEIYDDTDTLLRSPGQQVNFYANYSRISDGQPITGVSISCNITFPPAGMTQMTYNSTFGLYTYNRSFDIADVYNYNVVCNDSSDTYTGISLSDLASISSKTIPGANITVISSERANLTSDAGSTNVEGGNVTSINLNATSITPSWQGFYGNISGRIVLKSPEENLFYDWNDLRPQGEVYASRSSAVNFDSINCTTPSEVSDEETYLGQSVSSSDSVTNTFTKVTHPAFSTGLVNIPPDTCKSTNIYVSGSSQNLTFYEVLLSDGASNMVYTAIIDARSTGFDGRPYDFQMLVGQNGHTGGIVPYYFYLDLD
jgi:hypothetical protein